MSNLPRCTRDITTFNKNLSTLWEGREDKAGEASLPLKAVIFILYGRETQPSQSSQLSSLSSIFKLNSDPITCAAFDFL